MNTRVKDIRESRRRKLLGSVFIINITFFFILYSYKIFYFSHYYFFLISLHSITSKKFHLKYVLVSSSLVLFVIINVTLLMSIFTIRQEFLITEDCCSQIRGNLQIYALDSLKL